MSSLRGKLGTTRSQNQQNEAPNQALKSVIDAVERLNTRMAAKQMQTERTPQRGRVDRQSLQSAIQQIRKRQDVDDDPAPQAALPAPQEYGESSSFAPPKPGRKPTQPRAGLRPPKAQKAPPRAPRPPERQRAPKPEARHPEARQAVHYETKPQYTREFGRINDDIGLIANRLERIENTFTTPRKSEQETEKSISSLINQLNDLTRVVENISNSSLRHEDLNGIEDRIAEVGSAVRTDHGNEINSIASRLERVVSAIDQLGSSQAGFQQDVQTEIQRSLDAGFAAAAPDGDDNRSDEIDIIVRRLEDITSAVDGLGASQNDFHTDIRSDLAQQATQANSNSTADKMQQAALAAIPATIDSTVRNIFDKLDSLEQYNRVPGETLEQIALQLESLVHISDDRLSAPGISAELSARFDAMASQLDELDGIKQTTDFDVQFLRDEFSALQNVLTDSMQPQLSAIENQIKMLGNQIVPGETYSAGEGAEHSFGASFSQLAEKIDRHGDQLSGLATIHQSLVDIEAKIGHGKSDVSADAARIAETVISRAMNSLRNSDSLDISRGDLNDLEDNLRILLSQAAADSGLDIAPRDAPLPAGGARQASARAARLDKDDRFSVAPASDELSRLNQASARDANEKSDGKKSRKGVLNRASKWVPGRRKDESAFDQDFQLDDPSDNDQELIDSAQAERGDTEAPTPKVSANQPLEVSRSDTVLLSKESGRSKTDFIEAARHAARQAAQTKDVPKTSRLRRALGGDGGQTEEKTSRFALRKKSKNADDSRNAKKEAKQARGKKSGKEPALNDDVIAKKSRNRANGSAGEHSAAAESFISRHSRSLLLGASVVAVSLLAFNLVGQQIINGENGAELATEVSTVDPGGSLEQGALENSSSENSLLGSEDQMLDVSQADDLVEFNDTIPSLSDGPDVIEDITTGSIPDVIEPEISRGPDSGTPDIPDLTTITGSVATGDTPSNPGLDSTLLGPGGVAPTDLVSGNFEAGNFDAGDLGPNGLGSNGFGPNGLGPTNLAPSDIASTDFTQPEPVPTEIGPRIITRTITPVTPETDLAKLSTAPDANLPSENIGLSDTIGSAELRAAALSGDRTAEYEVAAIFTDGQAIDQDMTKASVWYQRSANQGFVPAQYRLAALYENGEGFGKNIEQARAWYERAAIGGNRMAMHNLATIYANGSLGEPDFDKASEWYGRAAATGLKDSQFNLGILYARGLGVEQDLASAYRWLGLAASLGDTDAAKSRDDIAASLDAQQLRDVKSEVLSWKPTTIDIAANYAPIGAWSDTFNAGATVDDLQVVKRVQFILDRLGFDAGTPDGVMGPRTGAAIAEFERATGMSVTGAVNPRLLAVLGSQPV